MASNLGTTVSSNNIPSSLQNSGGEYEDVNIDIFYKNFTLEWRQSKEGKYDTYKLSLDKLDKSSPVMIDIDITLNNNKYVINVNNNTRKTDRLNDFFTLLITLKNQSFDSLETAQTIVNQRLEHILWKIRLEKAENKNELLEMFISKYIGIIEVKKETKDQIENIFEDFYKFESELNPHLYYYKILSKIENAILVEIKDYIFNELFGIKQNNNAPLEQPSFC